MKVLIADKLHKVRSALRLLVEQEIGGQVVGEASSAQALFRYLGDYQPDLLILEWELPGLEDMDRITPIRRLCPDLKLVAVLGQGTARENYDMAGADAVISKGDSPQRVVSSLQSFMLKRGILPGLDLQETQSEGD